MKFHVKKREILVVDGYNVINAWNHLSEVSKQDLPTARESYIEKFIAQYKNKRHFELKVVTDDMAEQQLVLGKGATRISTRELELDFQKSRTDIKKQIEEMYSERNTIDDILDADILRQLDKMRKEK